ncbi:unnamed protein product [Adineta steineri]|uniref:Uncharacterized protein n=1 Tax=Adineta steineri TaxID=433720 RepID=A0A815ZRD2_9BILA|nr:unnamed protein product [Adineta steineri]CAF1325139.1 unnamed protein product [Adineta steineri]CAF1586590.1 unnamed protein product [Adineta steineri]CAF1586725.1 unnamed protein product [Adineta steineri]
MDDDLAFCLGRFTDHQVQLIDDRIAKIKEEENEVCREIEERQAAHIKNRPPQRDKGSHAKDKALVDKFVSDLRQCSAEPRKIRAVTDDQTCIDSLRAELWTKVAASTTYINRLHNLARPLSNTAKFVETCRETVESFKRPSDFDANYKVLYKIIEQDEKDQVIGSIQKWWKEKYGDKVAEINQRNQKFNGAVTEPNFAILSPNSGVIRNAKKLIEARQETIVEPEYFEVVREFVRQLLLLDEEKREHTDANELSNELNSRTIEETIDYAERWLSERDEIRNRKEEDPYKIELEEAKAKYGRQRMARRAQKFAVAAFIRQLAAGSKNDEQFQEQLDNIVKQERKINEETETKEEGKNNEERKPEEERKTNAESLPVIPCDIGDPNEEELPVTFELKADAAFMNQFKNNSNEVQERFIKSLCQAFSIPSGEIRIKNIDCDKAIICILISKPHGTVVVKILIGGVEDAVARKEAVCKCFSDINANVDSIILGEVALEVEGRRMDPRWNKNYVSSSNDPTGQYWANSINQGGKPYFCPSGWKRYGIKVDTGGKEFDAKWGTWNMAYHGTRSEVATNILMSGLKVGTHGCHYDDGVRRVYVSPSIEYCAHQIYACPWEKTTKNGENLWYQLVFQCRVNPKSIASIKPETILGPDYKKEVIDPNFKNSELEWIILDRADQEFIADDIICYGMMMRTSKDHPKTLTPSKWWEHTDPACYSTST